MSSFKQKVISGLAWSGAVKLLTQALSWISTFIVIRHLDSSDYAILGVTFALTGITYVLSEFGLADAVIQKQRVTKKNLSQVFSVIFASNALILLVFYLSSSFFADFYEIPALVSVMVFAGANLLLSSFIVVPESLLNKKLLFKERAIVETIASLSSTAATLMLAVAGFGYWSILIGMALGTFIKVTIFNLLGFSGYRFTIDFSGFRDLINFGFYSFVSRVVWALYNRLDVLVIGKLFGPTLLGVYSVALQLASMPLDKISGTINQVAFSAFSLKQQDKGIEGKFRISMMMVSAICFPLFLGLATVAPIIVPLLIGEQWSSTTVFIQILAIMMPFKMVSSFVNTFIASKGGVKFNFKTSLVYLFFICIGLSSGNFVKLVDMTVILVSCYLIAFLINMYLCSGKIGCHYLDIIKPLIAPIVASTIMYMLVYWFNETFKLSSSLILALMLNVALGASIYSVCLFSINKSYFGTLFQLIRVSKKA